VKKRSGNEGGTAWSVGGFAAGAWEIEKIKGGLVIYQPGKKNPRKRNGGRGRS